VTINGPPTGQIGFAGVSCDPAWFRPGSRTPRSRSGSDRAKYPRPTEEVWNAPRTNTPQHVEFRVFRIEKVTLVEAKLEPDKDIHLVVADDMGRTMIVEFADPGCPDAATSAKATQMTAARNAYLKACEGLPKKSGFTKLKGQATIEGVGFFDIVHAEDPHGVAPNEIELHPVLRFQASDANCRRI
jgi:hypothetical protein